ncbi:hypothetical protein FRC20_000112 [Serendipita sp. 405]|nr:hypothetical protein FRC20_000112 [Serendipita sp. 405]
MPPAGGHLQYFEIGGKYKTNGTHREAWCKFCISSRVIELSNAQIQSSTADEVIELKTRAELVAQAKLDIPPMVSKSDKLKRHLASCPHAPESAKQSVSDEDINNEPPSKRQKLQYTLQVTTKPKWDEQQQDVFNKNLCRLFIASGFSWNTLSNPEFKRFARIHLGDPPLPSRQTLAGRVLRDLVNEVEGNVQKEISGQMGTGQCDGWKNITRTAVVASIVTVRGRPHILHVHNITSQRKDASNLLSIVLSEIAHLSNLGVTIVGWCSDAGGDSRAMRLRLAQLMPQLIVLDCWAHQVNLIVGDYFKLKNEYIETIDKAVDVIKWFNNHTRALGIFQAEQKARSQRVLSLFLPVLTRWTSHYLSLTRLCNLKLAMQTSVINHREDLVTAAGDRPEQTEMAEDIVAIIEDRQFWKLLDEVCLHLQPLATAANATQSSQGRLDSIVLTLGNLYCRYSQDPKLSVEIRTCILDSIEKRWAKTDQDAFIMAIIMNPYIRTTLFKSGLRLACPAGVFGLTKRLWTRFFPFPHDVGLFDAVEDYCAREGSFSDASLHLSEHKRVATETGNLDLRKIWSSIDTGIWKGSNQLVKLAIRIFSVVGNSADCERLFSAMGDIHSKKRNRLSEQRVRDIAVVKMAIQREHKSAKPRPVKRTHDQIDTIPSSFATEDPVVNQAADPVAEDQVEADVRETADFGSLAKELTASAEADDVMDMDESLNENPPPAAILRQLNIDATRVCDEAPRRRGALRLYFGTNEPISLVDLFDFGTDKAGIWDALWNTNATLSMTDDADVDNDAVPV